MHVTVVEMMPSILMGTTEPEFIATVEEKLNAAGIRLFTEQKVTAFEPVTGGGTQVHLGNGDGLHADLVVLSMGGGA